MADHVKVVASENLERPVVPGTWSAEKIERIDEHLYKLTNLSVMAENVETSVKILKGNFYITEYNRFYWHFLHEDIAGYEGIKSLVPDLQLAMLNSQDVMADSRTLKSGDTHYPYLEYFARLYNIDEIVDTRSTSWTFETVYFTTSSTEFLSDPNFWGENLPLSVWPAEGFEEWDKKAWLSRSPHSVRGLGRLTRKLYSEINYDYSLPKKIFISRKDVNSRLKKLIDAPGYEHLVEERLFEGEFLENYFEAKGYEVVALEDYSYEKQMQLFMNASHIAGTVGAGFANLHMSQPGTKLYELHVIPIYGFDYGYFQGFRGIDYHPVELRDLENKRTLTELEMLEVLDEQGI
jgi:hypothetical protein